MIHRFTKKGLNFLLDVNSGAVHLLDDVSYAVSGLIDEKMTETCPLLAYRHILLFHSVSNLVC